MYPERPGRRKGNTMNNDLLLNAEIDYRVNRIREDWRPIRARRSRRRERREGLVSAETSNWIG
jgi:hypothetical protein